MSLSSQKLIINIKNGDSNAYKELFDSFYESLYAFSFNYVKDTYVAEEITENVMLTIWEKRDNLDPEKSIKSYLYTSVRNASFDYLKKKNKMIPLDIDLHDTSFSYEQQIIKEETHKLLIQALNSLPNKCKQVFEMCCIEGLKYKEVAEALQISVNTVKSQRSRAIELLKEDLKNSQHFVFFVDLFLIK